MPGGDYSPVRGGWGPRRQGWRGFRARSVMGCQWPWYIQPTCTFPWKRKWSFLKYLELENVGGRRQRA